MPAGLGRDHARLSAVPSFNVAQIRRKQILVAAPAGSGLHSSAHVLVGWLHDPCPSPHAAIRSYPRCLGDLTNFAERPLAAVSNTSTPRTRPPFYLQLASMRCRAATSMMLLTLITGGSSGTVRRPRRKTLLPAARWCWSHAPWNLERRQRHTGDPKWSSTRAIYPTWMHCRDGRPGARHGGVDT